VQPGGTGLSLRYGCGKEGAGWGGEGVGAVSEVSEAELREWEEEQGVMEQGGGGEQPLFFPTPNFMASTGVK